MLFTSNKGVVNFVLTFMIKEVWPMCLLQLMKKAWPMCPSLLIKGVWPMCCLHLIKKVWPVHIVPNNGGGAYVLMCS